MRAHLVPSGDFRIMPAPGNGATLTISVLDVPLPVVQLQATEAELLSEDGALGATFTFRVIVELPFTAIDVAMSVQVTAWPVAEQLHPVPVPLAKAKPPGSVHLGSRCPVQATTK